MCVWRQLMDYIIITSCKVLIGVGVWLYSVIIETGQIWPFVVSDTTHACHRQEIWNLTLKSGQPPYNGQGYSL